MLQLFSTYTCTRRSFVVTTVLLPFLFYLLFLLPLCILLRLFYFLYSFIFSVLTGFTSQARVDIILSRLVG